MAMIRTKIPEFVEDPDEVSRKRSQLKDILGRLIRNRLGTVGLIIVVLLLVVTIFAGIFTKYDYAEQDYANKFAYPSWEHPMGTDNFGRDIWSRLLYGGRISLLVAISATIISIAAGMIFGAFAGFFGGKIDTAITRFLDILMSVPGLLLAIAVSSALGSGPINTAIAIAISAIPYDARIMRSTVMSVKSNEFVEAATATGSRNLRTIFRHILPNTFAPLIVSASLDIGGNIMAISGLSFIGLGVQPPIPEWGSILAAGRLFIRDFWPIIVFPALFIALTLFGFNLFGDALRDALDPRLKD